jgi:hypothetical protein
VSFHWLFLGELLPSRARFRVTRSPGLYAIMRSSRNPHGRGRARPVGGRDGLMAYSSVAHMGILARATEVRRIAIGTASVLQHPEGAIGNRGSVTTPITIPSAQLRFLRARSNLLCSKCIRASAVRFRNLYASPIPKLIRGAVPVDFSICSFARACDKRSKAICAANGNVRTRKIKCPTRQSHPTTL